MTAIGLSLYLAGVQLSIPAAPISVAPKLLVLDDVLIGLDIAHRIPVLKLLQKEFRDWQIILMTYDRVWYELAKEYTEGGGKWVYGRMYEVPSTPNLPTLPAIEMEGSDPVRAFLARAETHINDSPPDLMAAAVYIRAAFERRIKIVCRDRGIKVAYKPNPKDVKADHLWNAIKDRQATRSQEGRTDFLRPNLLNDVETIRSTVLNKLSHSGTPDLVTADVQFALETMRKLQHYDFPRS